MSYSLLQGNELARIASWLIGILGTLGNILLLIYIYKIKSITIPSKVNPIALTNRSKIHKSSKVSDFLICNLAIADIIGCTYLTIIAAADAYYGYRYPTIYQVVPYPINRTNIWLQNPFCYIARYAFLTSPIASIVITMLIAIDRFIVVLFPYSSARLNLSKCKILMTIVWIFLCCFSGLGFSIGIPTITRSSKLFTPRINLCMNIAGSQQFRPLLISRQTIYYTSCGTVMLCYCIIIAYIRRKKTSVSKHMNVIERRIFIMMLIITATNVFSILPTTVLYIQASSSGNRKPNIKLQSNGLQDWSGNPRWNSSLGSNRLPGQNGSPKWNASSLSSTLSGKNGSSRWQSFNNLNASYKYSTIFPTKHSLAESSSSLYNEPTSNRHYNLSSFNLIKLPRRRQSRVQSYNNTAKTFTSAIILSFINAAINPIIYFCFSWSINHRKWDWLSKDRKATMNITLRKCATESNNFTTVQHHKTEIGIVSLSV